MLKPTVCTFKELALARCPCENTLFLEEASENSFWHSVRKPSPPATSHLLRMLTWFLSIDSQSRLENKMDPRKLSLETKFCP